jgi:hypothetical protein
VIVKIVARAAIVTKPANKGDLNHGTPIFPPSQDLPLLREGSTAHRL